MRAIPAMQPNYIERGGDLVFPQPFLHQNVKLHGFFLRCDRKRLQALVARSLPQSDTQRFEAAGDQILLTVAMIPKISSTDPQGKNAGWASEIDVAFWLPVTSLQGGQRVIDWYIPYIFVDNPYAMAIGRESYGFPKALGYFSLPRDLFGEHLSLFSPLGTSVSSDGGYHIDLVGLSSMRPDVQATRLRLLSLTPTPTSSPAQSHPLAALLKSVAPLFFAGEDKAFDISFPQIKSFFFNRGLSLLFLRQLRDINSPQKAAYQELLRAPAKVAAMRGSGLLPGSYQLRFFPCASHPVAQDLGIETTIATGFWLDFDFLMDKGERITERVQTARPKKKIAILGGGIGALSTALSLTDPPNWQDDYEITLYQTGWRLGGKCASSRNPREGGRIEEHGLHLWFGCYENAFRMIRRCYAELQRPSSHPMQTFCQAFAPEHDTALHQHEDGQGWAPWKFHMPSNKGMPGDATREDIVGLLQNISTWLGASLEETATLQALPKKRSQKVWRMIHTFQQVLFSAQGLQCLARLAEPSHIAMLRGAFRSLLAKRGKREHRLWLLLDVGLTALYGVLRDQALTRGLHTLDDEEFLAWLARHGASPETLRSAPVRVLYDLVFAYEGGDLSKPNLAAGAALQTAFRLSFDYRGAFMWKMQAGMGETVITPMYELLRQRGVRFEFFHHVKRLELSPEREISRIRLSRQATLKTGEYQPLVEINGLGCWPDEPLYTQLEEGESLRGLDLEHRPFEREERCLLTGRDFDSVVLAIPVGALHEICAPLADALPRWREMLEHLKTNATLSAQLWSKAPPHKYFLQGTYQGSFSTCADMSHILREESWLGGEAPRSLAYLCGVYCEEQSPAVILDEFKREHAPYLWKGADALSTVYLRTNTEGSERYTPSHAGSGRYRIKPGDSGVANLFLAGDWTDNGLNLGCVEATVISGMQCARALSGRPVWIYGERWSAPGFSVYRRST